VGATLKKKKSKRKVSRIKDPIIYKYRYDDSTRNVGNKFSLHALCYINAIQAQRAKKNFDVGSMSSKAVKVATERFMGNLSDSMSVFVDKNGMTDKGVKKIKRQMEAFKKWEAKKLEGSGGKLMYNVEFVCEMMRENKIDLLYTYAKLRKIGSMNAGYFMRKGKYITEMSSAQRRHIKELRKMGFISDERVLKHRRVALRNCKTTHQAYIPHYALESKIIFKGYLLSLVTALLGKGVEKAETDGVNSYDYESGEWTSERFDRGNHSSILKFNDTHTFVKVSDSIISQFLKTPVSTIRKWRNGFNVDNHVYLDFLVRTVKDSWDWEEGFKKSNGRLKFTKIGTGKNHDTFFHRVRLTHPNVKIFLNSNLTSLFLERVHTGLYNQTHFEHISEICVNGESKFDYFESDGTLHSH